MISQGALSPHEKGLAMKRYIGQQRVGYGGFLLLFTLFLSVPLKGLGAETFVFDSPSDDQWQYPFNFSPGLETDRSLFATTSPAFDGRDAMAIVRWETAPEIPAGLDVEGYLPTRLAVRVWNAPGAAWLPSVTEVVQLFAVGYGPTYTESSWTESSAIRANGAGPPTLRDPYPLTLGGSRAENQLNAQPWAVGVPVVDASGILSIEFELDLLQPGVRDYVIEGLDVGRLTFAVSSTFIPSSSMPVPGSLPRMVFSEGTVLYPGTSAPELTVVLSDDPTGEERRYDSPSADLWQYPFNFTPGIRATAPLFSAGTGSSFDFRDGQMVLKFDTAPSIPAGAPEYKIAACSLRVWSASGAAWVIRDTTTSLEVFGTGFGPTYTSSSWSETSPIRAGAPGPSVLRDPHPIDIEGNRAENNPSAVPFSRGRTIGYNPGAQSSPFLIQYDFDLTVPEVSDYLRAGLSSGELFFHLAADRGTEGGTPNILTKEGLLGVGAGRTGGNGEAPELWILLETPPASVSNWELY